MLLYHFPLNTADNISNFTNVGLLQDYLLKGKQESPASEGVISQKCLETKTNTFSVLMNSPIQFSLAFRFKLKSLTNNAWTTLICFYQNTTNRRSIYWNANTTKLYFGGTPVNPDLNWHNVVVEYQDNTCKIYLDNVLVETVSSQIFTAISLFDRFYDRNYTLQAYIQDIRIYDYALSQAEINEYSRALVVHYPLQGNELNQSVLKDVSGLGNDLEGLPNSYKYEEKANGNARGDKMLQLSTKAFSATYTTQLKGNPKARSISFWWKASQQATGVSSLRGLQLFILKSSEITAWLIYNGLNSTANILNLLDIGGVYNVSSVVWHHFVYVIDQATDTIKFYYDTVLRGTVQISSLSTNRQNVFRGECVLNAVFSPFNWGTTPDNPASNFSDIRIYATALSAEDIKKLYNSPISVSKQHQTMAFEFKENPLYPSKYWRTPTYAEMNYILNTRTNAANLRTLGRVEISSGVYRNGCFLLPDNWVLPAGLTMIITTANYTTNSYSLDDFAKLENAGAVFLPYVGTRNGVILNNSRSVYSLGSKVSIINRYTFAIYYNGVYVDFANIGYAHGVCVRLCKSGSKFSVSATTKIDFAPANLQYHCTQHKWRFAEHSYDIIGADNANISDSYNGWIDLFGYGTSGVNYSPTLHTTNNADYASGDITNTDNDWGVNEIQSYDYNVKNFALNKNGIVQHNDIIETTNSLTYPINYWRTPKYDELNYILNTRNNAANLKTAVKIELHGDGLLLLPDDWICPSSVTLIITTNPNLNQITLEQFKILESAGAKYFPNSYYREGTGVSTGGYYWTETNQSSVKAYQLVYDGGLYEDYKKYGSLVRLCRTEKGNHSFSTSPSTFIQFAKSNLKYHCTQHIWAFHTNAYDSIGTANENISDSYNGWIDLFGFGTSGVNYSPTMTDTTNSHYARTSLNGTDNDWGINEIASDEFNVNGVYNNKLITNELIEN